MLKETLSIDQQGVFSGRRKRGRRQRLADEEWAQREATYLEKLLETMINAEDVPTVCKQLLVPLLRPCHWQKEGFRENPTSQEIRRNS